MLKIKIGDIVEFKKVRKITLEDLVARKEYSRYMLVVDIIYKHTELKNPLIACKVLCANGEINWVSINNIELSK